MAFDEESYNRQIARDYRWNFAVSALDGVFYWFGISFVSGSTVIPVYAARLTSNPVVIGLITAIASSGWFLPQLLTANLVERLPRRKPLVVVAGFFLERLPFLLLAVSTHLFAVPYRKLALVLLLLFYAWHSYGAGFLATAWQDMIAKIIPPRRRGRFFGISNFGGAALGVLGAQATARILARYTFPNNFALCMLCGFALISLSWLFLAMTREPAYPPQKERISHGQYWRSLPRLLRADLNFRHYLAARALTGFSRMASVGLAAVYAVERWRLPDQQAGVFTTILLIAQTVLNLAFGYLGDQKGHKLSLELGIAGWAAAMAAALWAPNPLLFSLLFFAGAGAATASELVAGPLVLLEFASPADRPTYIGLGNTTTGIFSAIAPLVGGWLAALFGYRPLFAIALLLTAMAWGVMHWAVHEPRHLHA